MKIKTLVLTMKFLYSYFIERFRGGSEDLAVEKAMSLGGYDEIAGIEAVRVDGDIFYYAYNYSSDSVASPIFSRPDKMSAYATKYLAHKDGKHSKKYWDEEVEHANEYSGIFTDVPEFSKNEYGEILDNLEHIVTTGVIKRDIHLSSFMTDILVPLDRECIDDELAWSAVMPTLEKHNIDSGDLCSNDVEEFLNKLSGHESKYESLNNREAAALAIGYLKAVAANAKDGWEMFFVRK